MVLGRVCDYRRQPGADSAGYGISASGAESRQESGNVHQRHASGFCRLRRGNDLGVHLVLQIIMGVVRGIQEDLEVVVMEDHGVVFRDGRPYATSS